MLIALVSILSMPRVFERFGTEVALEPKIPQTAMTRREVKCIVPRMYCETVLHDCLVATGAGLYTRHCVAWRTARLAMTVRSCSSCAFYIRDCRCVSMLHVEIERIGNLISCLCRYSTCTYGTYHLTLLQQDKLTITQALSYNSMQQCTMCSGCIVLVCCFWLSVTETF